MHPRLLSLIVYLVAFAHIPVVALLDENADGISDVWQDQFADLALFEDPDGDGFLNIEEAVSGTSPFKRLEFPSINRVEIREDGETALTLKTARGVFYQLEVSGDLENWMPVQKPFRGLGGEQQISFDATTAFSSAPIMVERWLNFTARIGEASAFIAAHPEPDERFLAQGLDIPRSAPDVSDMLQRVSGFFVAPESGDYTFFASADDHAVFSLSTDATRARLEPIAVVPRYTSRYEWDKYPEQRSNPVNLQAGKTYAFELLHQERGSGDHVAVAWLRPGHALSDTPEVVSGDYLSLEPQSVAEIFAAQNRLFYRAHPFQYDSDGDGLSDYEEGQLGFNWDLPETTPRQADLDAARAVMDAPSTVTVGASIPRAYESDAVAGRFLLTRSGGVKGLQVDLDWNGSATMGADFYQLPVSVFFPYGQREISLEVRPIPDALIEPRETVQVQIAEGSGYLVGPSSSATVAIDDQVDVNYVALLRRPEASYSAGYGFIGFRQAGNGLSGEWSASFSGLSSDVLGIEAFLSDSASGGRVLLDLGLVPLDRFSWDFSNPEGLAPDVLVAALAEGRVWARIKTADFPEGEIVGQLQTAANFQQMPKPPAPEWALARANSRNEAARFLIQATYGPSPDSIDTLLGLRYSDWLDEQFSLPPSYISPYTRERMAQWIERTGNGGGDRLHMEAFWENAYRAPDQLRQRMAFALSQIMVISTVSLPSQPVGISVYYDMLLEHAFGNFRDLLEEVTKSPVMGQYLSMIRNRKPDPATGHEPDENYAREILQLFSIGLVQMHADGSPKLSQTGLPLPTYSQDDIVALAHIFTGWGPHFDPQNSPLRNNGQPHTPTSQFLYGQDYVNPMSFLEEFHDQQDRTVLGTTIPGSLSGEERMDRALDVIFNHPNVGPFVAKQLIQRFVTSNPSPAYVYRVASAFNDNGKGERGDLAATLRAVLLDVEARNPSYRQSDSYGKLVEPILRVSRMLRAFESVPPLMAEGNDYLYLDMKNIMPEQAPLRAPSVFNFFMPGYSKPGPIAAAGLLSPEFQILNESTIINQANIHNRMVLYNMFTPETNADGTNARLEIDLSIVSDFLPTDRDEPADAKTQKFHALIDYLDGVLLAGEMTDNLKSPILAYLQALDAARVDYEPDTNELRAEICAWMILVSPEFNVQK